MQKSEYRELVTCLPYNYELVWQINPQSHSLHISGIHSSICAECTVASVHVARTHREKGRDAEGSVLRVHSWVVENYDRTEPQPQENLGLQHNYEKSVGLHTFCLEVSSCMDLPVN